MLSRYIPKGRWTDIFTNQIYEGEQVLSLYRNLIISFKDIIKGNISCNVEYKIIDDNFIKIEVNDINSDIVIEINNAKYLKNIDKKEALINLISSYQMDNITRAEMFCNIINDINYKIKAPKHLLEPINEILKMDK